MLYLKSLVLDRFKSFKHSELLFSKGFTCVVGPNGSGKSNIFDALLFGLGETSLQRLRADNLQSLIDNSIKKKDGVAKAYIRMEFAGDQDLSITKTIKSDGQSDYHLNGKHTTRKEVLEVLGRYGVRSDETTTIAQGEIHQIAKLNPKERRELIDIAAGIKEFEYKRNEALRELEKVDQKISEANVALGERTGFLKELEKEKEAAELYLKLGGKLKSLKYSILLSRKEMLQESYDSSTSQMALLDSKMISINGKAEELQRKIDQFNSERQQITKELTESTSSISEKASKLQNLDRESAKLEAELNSDRSNAKIAEQEASFKKNDITATKAKMAENSKTLSEMTKELASIEKELEGLSAELESGELEKKIGTLNTTISELGNRLIDAQSYISKLQAELLVGENERETATASKKSEAASIEASEKELESHKKRALEIKERLQSLGKGLSATEREIIEANKEIGSIESQTIDLMQQRAIAQSKEGGTPAKISEQFSEKDGFYGKASQLCTYKGEYAIAIETSAGSRFDFYVVDTITTANRIIGYLKKNGLGRATFIPLKELNFERGGAKGDSLKPVLGLLQYDSRFGKAFEYIFSNTFLIDDVEDAKRLGIGKHRYVTLEGELVEQSGVLSGGSQKRRLSLASIENSIKEQNSRKSELRQGNEQLNKRLVEQRKEQTLLEMEQSNIAQAQISIEKRIEGSRNAIKRMEELLSVYASTAKKHNSEIAQHDAQKMEIERSLTAAKDELKNLYDKSMAATKKSSRHPQANAEMQRINAMRNRADELRIKRAELQKENEMLEQNASEAERYVADRSSQARETAKGIKEKELRLAVLLKSRAEIDSDARKRSASYTKASNRLSAIDSEISKLSAQHGAAKAETEGFNRQLNEIRITRSQSETRLHDITAELSTYQGQIEAIKGRMDEMESEAGVVEAKISQLGNVNLKAPEVYDEKKRSMEEAASKVEVLQSEKGAVLKMIEDIDSKKLQIFMYTFNEVNKNFIRLYKYIFTDDAAIVLENEKDPLNSGLEISVKNGKVHRIVSSMSGGEKSLISLVLLFAIHTFKPSSLYIFDEVDSALDKENSKKLSMLIKQMSKDAQFVVVSHNDSLIVNADTAIGVVKTENESKAIGLEVPSILNKK